MTYKKPHGSKTIKASINSKTNYKGESERTTVSRSVKYKSRDKKMDSVTLVILKEDIQSRGKAKV